MRSPSSVPESLQRRLDLAAHRGDRDGLVQVLLDGARRLSGADRAALVRPRSHERGVLLLRSWPEDVEISTTAVRHSLHPAYYTLKWARRATADSSPGDRI